MSFYVRYKLGAIMRDQGISEKELSEMTGVARTAIRAMIRNANRRTDWPTVEKLAQALGRRPLELFEETAEPPEHY